MGLDKRQWNWRNSVLGSAIAIRNGTGGQSLLEAVDDSTSNRMIVFSGVASSGIFNDVWVLTNANGLGGTPSWIQLSPSGSPSPARSAGSAVYDANTNRLILFGGIGTAAFFNDTWVLSNANGLGGSPAWTQLAPAGALPTARNEHAAA